MTIACNSRIIAALSTSLNMYVEYYVLHRLRFTMFVVYYVRVEVSRFTMFVDNQTEKNKRFNPVNSLTYFCVTSYEAFTYQFDVRNMYSAIT